MWLLAITFDRADLINAEDLNLRSMNTYTIQTQSVEFNVKLYSKLCVYEFF